MTKSAYELFVIYEGQKFVGDQFHHFEATLLNAKTLEDAIQEGAEKLVEDQFWKEAQIRHHYVPDFSAKDLEVSSIDWMMPATVEKYFFRKRII